MSGTALASGKTFAQQLAAKLPEASRAAFLANFDGQDEALTLLGDSVLARSDYSRAMNDLKVVETKQTKWWTDNQPLLELGSKAKDAGWTPEGGGGNPPDPTGNRPAGMSPEDVTKLLDEREAGAAAFFATLSGLQMTHFTSFGEALDARQLMADAVADPQRRGLQHAYQTRFADRLAAKAKEKDDAAFEARYKERFAADVKTLGLNRPPDTIVGGEVLVSPLDALTPANAAAKAGQDVTDMVDMYNDLVAKSR